MNIQFLLYLLLATVLLLSYAALYLLFKIQKQKKILDGSNIHGSSEIIEKAQKQANAIVEKAVASAKNILFETEYVKQDMAKEMQDSLSKVAEESVKLVQGRSTESEKEFRSVVDEIKAEFANQASAKLSAIEKVAVDETNDFKETLRRETVGSQAYVGKKIGEDFQAVQGELLEYKKAKLAEIDNNISAITKQVVEEALGASITLPLHEDLIIKSLENAKKTGMFSNLETKKEGGAEA